MLTLPPTVRIFVSLSPADMRCSLDGLAALTREVLKEDPRLFDPATAKDPVDPQPSPRMDDPRVIEELQRRR